MGYLVLLLLAAAPPAWADTLFAAAGTNIYAVGMDGQVSLYATLPGPRAWEYSGLAIDRQGNLYTCSGRYSPEIDVFTPDGTVGVVSRDILPANEGAASLAVDSRGDLYRLRWQGQGVDEITPDGRSWPLPGFAGANGLTVDQEDNLYVSGIPPGGVTRVAADQTWQVVATGLPWPRAMAVDGAGNLYVGCADGTVRRIAPNGATNLLATGITDPGNLACDAAGNVFVASPTNVIRLDPQGHKTAFGTLTPGVVFLAPYRGSGLPVSAPGPRFSWVRSNTGLMPYGATVRLAAPAPGRLYVAGSVLAGTALPWPSPPAPAGPAAFFLSELDARGDPRWTRWLAGTNWSALRAIAADPQGGLYLAGGLGLAPATAGQGPRETGLVKTDEGGQPVWTREFAAAGQIPIAALAVNPAGQAAVAGLIHPTAASSVSVGKDVFVAKVDGGGRLLWTNVFVRPVGETPLALAWDEDLNLYVAGAFQDWLWAGNWVLDSQQAQTAFLAKLDAAGKVLWTTTISAASVGSTVAAVAVGPDHTVYVSGTATGTPLSAPNPTSAQPFLAKTDRQGQLLWVRMGLGVNGAATALAVDAAGTAYFSGTFDGALRLGDFLLAGGEGFPSDVGFDGGDLFVAAVDPGGRFLWARHAGASVPTAESVVPQALVVAGVDDVWLAGQRAGPTRFGGIVESVNASFAGFFVTRLSTNPAPVILRQPQPVTVAAGHPAVLSVVASGHGPLRYQWHAAAPASASGLPTAHSTNATLVFEPAQYAQQGSYWVDVEDDWGMVSSSLVPLTVLSPPVITVAPVAATGAAGGWVMFQVQADGSPPLAYQWLFNARPLLLQTSSVLVLNPLNPSQAGLYAVRITNPFGTTLSATVPLSVVPAPNPRAATLEVSRLVSGVTEILVSPPIGVGSFRVERSTDLRTWNSWTNVMGVPPGSFPPGAVLLIDPDASPASRRFYRALTP